MKADRLPALTSGVTPGSTTWVCGEAEPPDPPRNGWLALHLRAVARGTCWLLILGSYQLVEVVATPGTPVLVNRHTDMFLL